MKAKTYEDFDLAIERSGARYRSRVLNSPDGSASSEFDLPFSDMELENFVLRFGQTRRTMRHIGAASETTHRSLREFGARLYGALFNGPVSERLRGSLALVGQKPGAGLRIRLRLSDAPELIDMPWEYLFDASSGRFLTLSVDTPLVRYLDLPGQVKPLAVQPPLRILVMLSSPAGYAELSVDPEWRKLKEAVADLESRGLVVLERMEKPTLAELQRRLRRQEFHIFHFVGHGGFDEAAQDGVLILQTEDGKAKPTSGRYLGTLLHDHETLRLVVLNACEGGRTSRHDPFAGVGQGLVQQGIPAVVAMQFEISDQAAITLAHEFYAALADSYPVDAALAEARKAIFAQDNILEWGTPVLYMRAQDGRIFDLANPLPAPAGVGAQSAAAAAAAPAAVLPGAQAASKLQLFGAVDAAEKTVQPIGPPPVLPTPQPAHQTVAPARAEAKQGAPDVAAKLASAADQPAHRPAGAQARQPRRPLLALVGALALLLVAGTVFTLSRTGGRPSPEPTAILAPLGAAGESVGTAMPAAQMVATRQPTATFEPAATSQPTATARPATPTAPMLSAAQDAINVRRGPGTHYPAIGKLAAGQPYRITGKNAGGDWWQFDFNGQQGWVSAQLVQTTGPLTAIALVSAPTQAPTQAPTALSCGIQPGSTFARAWERSMLGCPLAAESTVASAYERFEHGWMLWRQDTPTDHWVFVDGNGYTVAWYPTSDAPTFSCPEAEAAGRPRLGFGRVWCEKTDIRQRIGPAQTDEVSAMRALQAFEHGFMIAVSERSAVVSVYTDGTWKEQRP